MVTPSRSVNMLGDASSAWDDFCAAEAAAEHDAWLRAHPITSRLQRLGRSIGFRFADLCVLLRLRSATDVIPF